VPFSRKKPLALLEEDARVARVHVVVTEAGQRLFAKSWSLRRGLKRLPAGFSGARSEKSKFSE